MTMHIYSNIGVIVKRCGLNKGRVYLVQDGVSHGKAGEERKRKVNLWICRKGPISYPGTKLLITTTPLHVTTLTVKRELPKYEIIFSI